MRDDGRSNCWWITMSMATMNMDTEFEDEAGLQYRALHTGALIALVLGIVSVFVVVTAASSFEWCLVTAPIPAVGIFVAVRSLAQIRQFPDQYTGEGLAKAGLVLSLIFLIGGVAYGGFVYATEVPEGYARLSFNTMKPSEIDERGGVLVPADVAALNGKKIFIKGYIRPDSIAVQRGIDRFLLVRDNNQCCFGDLSKIKYFDQIDVVMLGDRRVDYSQGVIRIGGTLHVQQDGLAAGGPPRFAIEADYSKN